jgi:uncharacterized membrane protein
MDQNFIANSLSITLFFVALFVSFRAFALYRQLLNYRLCILAVSMFMIALTAAAGFAGDNVSSISLNVDWFNYIGQTVSFLFILLSLFLRQERSLRSLLVWQLVLCVPLLVLLILSPVLPPEFPDPVVTKTLLSGSRGVICAFIFCYYASAFMTKESRFSFLMGSSFFLLSLGYFVVMLKYGYPSGDIGAVILDHVGDCLRISGLVTLLITVLRG